ncbi:MAG TPA: NADH-quinone oxidoreductase subunit NuoK [Verrucomicrobiae bacterium]|nr:NADH-quinone oxidoreductase subunit NuoK [Verrucomicrobiae bacterium]
MSIPLGHYLMLSGLLFAIGLGGALTRKNAIIVLIGIEIMFNAGILNLIAFWHYKEFAVLTAQMFAIFSISIAAAESAIGLALVIAVYRYYKSVDVDEMASLKG